MAISIYVWTSIYTIIQWLIWTSVLVFYHNSITIFQSPSRHSFVRFQYKRNFEQDSFFLFMSDDSVFHACFPSRPYEVIFWIRNLLIFTLMRLGYQNWICTVWPRNWTRQDVVNLTMLLSIRQCTVGSNLDSNIPSKSNKIKCFSLSSLKIIEKNPG